MEINKKFLDMLTKNSIDKDVGILYGLAVHFNEKYGTLNAAYNLIGSKHFKGLELNLTNYNREDKTYNLKESIFSNVVIRPGLFTEFKTKLKLESHGVEANRVSYVVITYGKDTEDAFNELVNEIPDIEIDKLVKIITRYYTMSTNWTMKLPKYLKDCAEPDYRNFKEEIDFDKY